MRFMDTGARCLPLHGPAQRGWHQGHTYTIPPVRLIGRLALSYASSLDLGRPIGHLGSL